MAKYWFKRKRYGWGWTPVTPAGWLVVGAVLLVAVGAAAALRVAGATDAVAHLTYLVAVALAVVALLWFTRHKRPTARWRWGRKPDDDPDEDF